MFAWPRSALAGALLALAAVYLIALRTPAAGIFHDDGVYLVTAKALATGHGYRIASLPGEIFQTKYPPLFPLLLAGAWKLYPRFPDNVAVLKCAPLLCAVAWFWLSYLLIKREGGKSGMAAVCCLLAAASPWVVFLSTALLSETLFAALCTACLILLRRLEREDGAPQLTACGAALLAGAAFLTRTAGIALIVAGLLMLVTRGRRLQALIFLLICCVVCAPWLAWQAHHRVSAAGVDGYYSAKNYASWNVLNNFSREQKASIVAQNVAGLIAGPAVLLGARPGTGGACVALAVAALLLVGLAQKRSRSIHFFLLVYFGLIVLWAWPPVRFIAPLLPILLFYTFRGLAVICPGRTALALAGALAAFSCSLGLNDLVRQTRRTATVGVPRLPADDWRDLRLLMDGIRMSTPPDAILLGNLDPVIYLYADRKAIRGFVQDPYALFYSPDTGGRPLGNAADLGKAMVEHQVAYLVCTPNALYREGPYLQSLISELQQAAPEAFSLLLQNPNPAYRVYRLHRAALAQFLSIKPDSRQSLGMLPSM